MVKMPAPIPQPPSSPKAITITQLSKNYREVLVRHFIHGQDVQSIADELDVNTNTVKSRLNTAKKLLKRRLDYDR